MFRDVSFLAFPARRGEECVVRAMQSAAPDLILKRVIRPSAERAESGPLPYQSTPVRVSATYNNREGYPGTRKSHRKAHFVEWIVERKSMALSHVRSDQV